MTTDPALTGVLEELSAREPLFHHPEFGVARADFESMITDDFWEVGASGQCYSRAFVLDVLDERYSKDYEEDWQADDFAVRLLGPGVYLLTYRLLQGKKRLTRRMTIWDNSTGLWKARYHQGTIIQDPKTGSQLDEPAC
ncbi:hypothetical protein J5X84_05410 [Streptosporangiaceae bacterium NEAU-GS5]|nr:hypothetical protein [Streptosporangiaceae bacterium NEAU-GS5]